MHVWNTFDTRGVCPNCDKQWKDTQCLECHRWSPHEDWYHGHEHSPAEEKPEHAGAGS